MISAEKLFVRHTENFRDSLELKIGNIAKLTFELGKTRCVEVDALDLELSRRSFCFIPMLFLFCSIFAPTMFLSPSACFLILITPTSYILPPTI